MNKLNILLIKNEFSVALQLSQRIIQQEGHLVECCTTIDEANDLLCNKKIDLILIDINLDNQISGIELYKSLNTTVPVIYLSVYRDENVISELLETNPFAYLVEPYNEENLFMLLKMATIKIKKDALAQKKSSFLNIGDEYFFNIEDNKLFFKEEYIKLSKKELLLLKLLIDAKEQVVSFEVIENELWQESIPSSSSVRTIIYRLRNKLKHIKIVTEFNYGIKLVR